MKDLLYKVALTKIPLVGAVTAKNLVSYCGGAKEVFEARHKQLKKIPGIGDQTAASIVNQAVLEEAGRELEFIEKEGIVPLFYLDKNYPQRLRHCSDAPVMLFYKGSANLNFHRTIGIVGTRKPTPQGISICEKLVAELAPFGPLVISGLAYGIDIAAHRKSLKNGLETVAVLGHGLKRIYPAQHRKTAFEMIGQGGLLTEFASNVVPARENFPMRNRIVAGLCDAVVVVETAKRGGSIITARLASGYSRDVFAFPGRVKDKLSQGCHYLIKSSLAQLVEGAADICKVLGWDESKGGDKKDARQQELFYALTEEEKTLVDTIQKAEEIGVDELSFQLKTSNSELAALLLNLEFQGIVRSLPGKRYVLT
ncbi:MAG TPA: DNA-protecting protein DprA [Bacteroidetes bacterium]|nr:DNA-protecting protein DprA [Bacteroidota bacterium]